VAIDGLLAAAVAWLALERPWQRDNEAAAEAPAAEPAPVPGALANQPFTSPQSSQR